MRSYTPRFRTYIGIAHVLGMDHTDRWWPTDTWPDLNLDRRQVAW